MSDTHNNEKESFNFSLINVDSSCFINVTSAD